MKKQRQNSLLLMLFLFFCFALNGRAQDQNWYDSIFQNFNVEHQKKIEQPVKQKDKTVSVIQNINKHRKQAAKLRAQGKSEKEIQEYFKTQLTAVGTGSISGIVYESDGVTPVQNYVSVKAYDEYGNFAGFNFISSGDNGQYTINGLSAGYYYVSTFSLVYIDEYYNNAAGWREATLVPVTDGQQTDGINFLLNFGGAISGRVAGIDGIPLYDCQIEVYDEDKNEVSGGSADDNGFYVVGGLTSGTYKLEADYYGENNYLGEWYDDTRNFETATVVNVTLPDTTKGIDFVLDYGGAIAGRVYKSTGEPVGAYDYCDITVYDEFKNWTDQADTDEHGYFMITRLETGSYRLYAEYHGGTDNAGVWYENAKSFEEATPVAVTAADTTKDLNITLRQVGAVSGKVYGPAGQVLTTIDCSVGIYDEDQYCIDWQQVNEDGSYMFQGLATGSYKLFAEYNGSPTGLYQKPAGEWYDGIYDFEDATLVNVNAPNTTANIDFTLENGGAITGHVYDPEGYPLNDYGAIYAYNQEKEWVQEYYMLDHPDFINTDGSYAILGLPSGEYRLQFDYDGEENYIEEWYNGKQNFETATVVSATASGRTENIDFTLEYSASINGFITDDAGNRLSDEDYLIETFLYDASSGEYVDFDMISLTGGYQFDEIIAGDYKLAAVSFYANVMPHQDSLAVSYYESGMSINDHDNEVISLTPNSEQKLNDFVMEKVSGAISGTIYYRQQGNYQPLTVGDYFVFAFDEDGYLAKTSFYLSEFGPMTGEYILSGLRPGNYYVLVPFGENICQWYDRIEANFALFTSPSNVIIPPAATAVTVGEGTTTGIDFYIELPTDVKDFGEIPHVQSFKLCQNYPNPFNPITTIEYELPKNALVEISIYNILGQKIQTLVKQRQSMGVHSIKWDASAFPSGIYFYKIEACEFKRIKKCLLLR